MLLFFTINKPIPEKNCNKISELNKNAPSPLINYHKVWIISCQSGDIKVLHNRAGKFWKLLVSVPKINCYLIKDSVLKSELKGLSDEICYKLSKWLLILTDMCQKHM